MLRPRARRDPHAHFVEAPGARLDRTRRSLSGQRPAVRTVPLAPLLDVMLGITLVLLTLFDAGPA